MPDAHPSSLKLGLSADLVDTASYDHAVARFRERRIALPKFAELARPPARPDLDGVDPDAPDPRNLWRVNWFNGADRKTRVTVPVHVVLPSALTGIESPVIVVLGNKFPMIRAHKVLAAYACLAPRIVTGQFDPTTQRAIWPSTGNYARGGVAISRIMACRGTAVLPEGMSRERFDWLARWTDDPADVVRTPGTESNVKEIYDACNELALDPQNVILNQFCEFANYLGHYTVTGDALAAVFEHVADGRPDLHLAAFTSATGSAGTIGAGDKLKERYGTKIVAVEALECPTLLENGYGEHNIQGIGDKHVPLIHNVMNTDVVVAISDSATDNLDILFNSAAGHEHLRESMGVSGALLEQLTHFGFSSIANVLAAIKTAKALRLGPEDAIITVATDGSEMYPSEREKYLAQHHPRGFDGRAAATVAGRYLQAVDTDHLIECRASDRNRMFNLGYYTWVEQQGIALAEFEVRRSQSFWTGIRALISEWDERIAEFNERTGMADL